MLRVLRDETSKSNTSGLLAQLTPGGQGGGYSPIKVSRVLVGKF